MELKHDSAGFLLGTAIEVAEIGDHLEAIERELRAIRAALEGDNPAPVPPVAIDVAAPPPAPAAPVVPRQAAGRATAAPTGEAGGEIAADVHVAVTVDAGRPEKGEAGTAGESPRLPVSRQVAEAPVAIDVAAPPAPAAPSAPPPAPSLASLPASTPAPAPQAQASRATLSSAPGAPSASPGTPAAAAAPAAVPRVDAPAGRDAAPSATESPGVDAGRQRPGAAVPAQRDASGRFVARGERAAPGGPGQGPSYGDGSDDVDREPGAIAAMGERIVNALRETSEGAEEADPAVKAFNEIAQPLQRGFGLIFGGSEERKQDRWYRRIWREMTQKRREDQAAQRQTQRTLRGIERNSGGRSEGGGGFMGLLGLLMPLLAPLLFILSGISLAVKGLSKLLGITRLLGVLAAAVAGLKALIPRSIRSFFGGERQAQPTRAGPAAGQSRGSTAGPADRHDAGRPAPGGTDAGGRIGGALSSLTKRLPIVGALSLSLGTAIDALGVLRSDASREEKSQAVGRAGGGVAGSLGGMWAGAKMGAALGALGGPIGAAIGSVVGGAAGAFFGDQAGQLVGEKVGGWVEDLRSANLTQTVIDTWRFTTDFAGEAWSQASAGVSERWAAASTYMSETWTGVSERATALWEAASTSLSEGWAALSEKLSNTWTSAVDAMQSRWKSAVDLAAAGWEAITGLAGKAADAVKKATGVDLKKTWADAKATASGLVDGAQAAVSSTWGKVSEAASRAAASVKSGARAVADATGVATVVRAGRNAYRHAEGKSVMRQAMAEAGITNPNEQAAFMAQMDHESAGFTRLEENLNYRPEQFLKMFGQRAGISTVEEAQAILSRGPEATGEAMYGGAWGARNLGNVEPGDGHRFRGRGYTQLTGRSNYEAAGQALGIDLVANPDLAQDPKVAAKIATWYWQNRSGLSDAAKRGDVEAVTRKINGGTNGLADRQAKTARYLAEAQAGELTVAPAGSVTPAADATAIAEAVASAPATGDAGQPAAPGALVEEAQTAQVEQLASLAHGARGEPAGRLAGLGHAPGIAPAAAGAGVSFAALEGPAAGVPAATAGRFATLAMPTASISTPTPAPMPQVRTPTVPAAAEAPRIDTPLAVGSGRSAAGEAGSKEVPRDLPDRRIAHIVTGAYSGMG